MRCHACVYRVDKWKKGRAAPDLWDLSPGGTHTEPFRPALQPGAEEWSKWLCVGATQGSDPRDQAQLFPSSTCQPDTHMHGISFGDL